MMNYGKIGFFVIAGIVFALSSAIVTASPAVKSQKEKARKVVVYSSFGPEIVRYDVDVKAETLTKRESVMLPENVQYAVAERLGRYLYVVSSDAGQGVGGAAGTKHTLSAFRIDPATGALKPHGQPASLPERPIHVTVDRDAKYALIALNKFATVLVYKIGQDGTIGAQVVQSERPDGGVFTHQVRVTQSNDSVIVIGRGNEATATKPEEIGSFTLFDFKDGILTKKKKIIMPLGRGPRHMDFHPFKPWVYVDMERGNKLSVFAFQDGMLSEKPLFEKETLLDLKNLDRKRQRAGVPHPHPNGKFLYISNRADFTTTDAEGKKVFAGGENNFAVFKINQKTGELTLIQHIDAYGIEPRTFSIDPSGKLLVCANQFTMQVPDGINFKTVPASLVIYRIGTDGKLTFVRKYEMTDPSKGLLWMNMVTLYY